MRSSLCAAALTLLVAAHAGRADVIHVAPNGSDAGDGSTARPLATLAAAQVHWRRTPGSSVVVAGGTYDLGAPLVLTADDSGTAGHPLTIAAAEGAAVIVTGAQSLGRLAWTAGKDGIWSAKVPDGWTTDQLWVDGKPQTLARYPNLQPGAMLDGTAADAFSPERAARWADPAGGYMHALHDAMWGSVDFRITGKDAAGNITFEGGWQMNRGNRPHKKYRYVEGIFEELDAPGEWFLNGKTSTLYFMPPAGMDLATAEVRGVRLATLVEARGTPDRPVRFVNVQGITFTQAKRTFMDTREPVLRSDWCIARVGAVLLHGAEDVTFDRCTFRDLGGTAVFLDGYNRRVAVRDSHITEAGASGVMVVGRPTAVRNPVVGYRDGVPLDQLDRTPGPCGDDYPADCAVDDCLIHRTGRVEKQSAGVCIDIARRITVSHCSIYDVPRAGINVGDGCWGGHQIVGNDVFDTVLETGDHGSFNAWGRDRFWSPSVKQINGRVAAVPTLPLLDAVDPIVLRGNRWRCDRGWDIDLDDGSTNYVIRENLCLNRGIKNREGFDRDVENNVCVAAGFDCHVWPARSGDVFAHNILAAAYGYKPIGMPPKPWGKAMDFNLLNGPAVGPATSLQHLSGRDAHSVEADAQFVDPAHGDYRVRPGSPALALGFVNFPMDHFGVTDPQLRALARTPRLPGTATTVAAATRDATPRQWAGATVRNIATDAEMSAYGTPGVTGVLVVTPPPNAHSPLRAGDVIVSVDGKATDAVTDLPAAAGRRVRVLRQQREVDLPVQGA
jgi:hypothetical protein